MNTRYGAGSRGLLDYAFDAVFVFLIAPFTGKIAAARGILLAGAPGCWRSRRRRVPPINTGGVVEERVVVDGDDGLALPPCPEGLLWGQRTTAVRERDRCSVAPLLRSGREGVPAHAVRHALAAAVVDVLLVDVAAVEEDAVLGFALGDTRGDGGGKLIAERAQ